MKKIFFSIAYLFISTQILFAQSDYSEYCGTKELNSNWIDFYHKNPHLFNDRFEEPTYLPMTIHLVGTDNGTGHFPKHSVAAAICQLNKDFAPANMQFYVEGEYNYINNSAWYTYETYQVGNQMMARNNVPNTINVYITQQPRQGICGYYTPQRDAIALAKGCTGATSRTWAHEMGHFLTLPHTFFGWEGIDYDPSKTANDYIGQVFAGIENVERNNCAAAADRLCETHPDYLSNRWNCNSQNESNVLQTDRNGDTFRSDGTLIMSYANDACQTRFTDDQIAQMTANVMNGRGNLFRQITPNPPITESLNPIYPLDKQLTGHIGVELKWNAVENAEYYQVQISRLPSFSGLIYLDEIITDTSIVAPDLDPNKKHFWRVRPFNDFDYCTGFDGSIEFTTSATSVSDFVYQPLFIHPNPANNDEEMFITNSDLKLKSGHILQIIDQKGSLIINNELNSFRIDLKDLKSGLYIFKIIATEKIYSAQVVIR